MTSFSDGPGPCAATAYIGRTYGSGRTSFADRATLAGFAGFNRLPGLGGDCTGLLACRQWHAKRKQTSVFTVERPAMSSDEQSVSFSRRQLLASAGTAGLALGGTRVWPPPRNACKATARRPSPVRYALNMSTVRGQKLTPPQQVDLAAKAGYDAIEPWINELRQYQESGGSISDLAKRIADHGLAVASAIGFAEWIVDDEQQRTKGLEQAQRDMALIRSIGGTHIAAPPGRGPDGENRPLGRCRALPRRARGRGQRGRRATTGSVGVFGLHQPAGRGNVHCQRKPPPAGLYAARRLSPP
jgi:hypothetical protein